MHFSGFTGGFIVRWATLLCVLSGAVSNVRSSETEVLARYGGTSITLPMIEAFDYELPPELKLSHASDADAWLGNVCELLAIKDVLTSAALAARIDTTTTFTRQVAMFQTQYLAYMAVRKFAYDRVQVTDDEVRAFYETHPQDFGSSALVWIKILKISDEETAMRAHAEMVAGATCDDVERQYSEMSGRTVGKVLGPFPTGRHSQEDELPDALLVPALKLEPEQFTRPIQYAGRFYIIQVKKKAPAQALPLDAVEGLIRGWMKSDYATVEEARLLKWMRAQMETTAPATAENEWDIPADRFRMALGYDAVASGATREVLLAAAAQASGLLEAAEFPEATAWFKLRTLSDAGMEMKLTELAPPVRDDEITSFLVGLRAFRAGDSFSERQITMARDQLTLERRAKAQQQVWHSVLEECDFERVSGGGVTSESLRITESEARDAALLSAGGRGWDVGNVRAIDEENGSSKAAGEATFGGVCGLVPNTCSAPEGRRVRSWEVTLVRRDSPLSRRNDIVKFLINGARVELAPEQKTVAATMAPADVATSGTATADKSYSTDEPHKTHIQDQSTTHTDHATSSTARTTDTSTLVHDAVTTTAATK